MKVSYSLHGLVGGENMDFGWDFDIGRHVLFFPQAFFSSFRYSIVNSHFF